jgi:2-iminoacetate synthase
MEQRKDFIDDAALRRLLETKADPERAEVAEILEKARELQGLTPAETAVLVNVRDPELTAALFATARRGAS